jgi:aspartyl-tRNA(Asn)/glutamyl-tRNA(Gln) amidotransferase subunit A
MSDDLAFTSAAELAARIRTKSLSPVELMRATLARIEALQPVLNCFITVCAEPALDAARAAEQAVMRGDPLGPLHGVPVSVKDLVNTAGVRTTFGSHVFETNVPAADAVSVARLKAAGAILVGKTTTPEFGHKPFTDAPLFGRTRNAWDATRTSGGSSGGAAVAVAAGLGPLAVATDGGGSTRIPAACNGVVGFKQTLGLVPHDQTPDGFGNQAFITPMTRTVTDTALMLAAMAGPDRADPHSIGLAKPDFVAAARPEGDLEGIRIAWRPYLGNSAIDREVLALCEQAVARLEALGAIVETVKDDFGNTEPTWLVLTHSFWHGRFSQYLAQHGNRMTPSLVRQIENGARYSAADLQQAMFARTAIYRQIQSWFDGYDLLVTPTLTRTALPIDGDLFAPIEIEGKPTDTARKAWYPYTHPFNLSGNPAVTLPCGFARDGLPVGFQIVGRLTEDATVLRAAALFEAAQPWADHQPSLR